MKLRIFLSLILCGACGALQAQQAVHSPAEIDTPTAFTISRGTYALSLFAYDRGGLEMKAFIGVHDNIYLGVSSDVEHAIGKDTPHFNIPGVVAKVKFTDGWETFPISIAAGYDSFYLGSEGKKENRDNELNRMIYGPYLVITKPIYLLDSEQHIGGGIRVPTYPHFYGSDTSYFASFDIPMGEFFTLKGETERVYYNFRRPGDWLFNTGFKYTYMSKFSIEFDLMFQYDEPVNSIIRVEYTDEF